MKKNVRMCNKKLKKRSFSLTFFTTLPLFLYATVALYQCPLWNLFWSSRTFAYASRRSKIFIHSVSRPHMMCKMFESGDNHPYKHGSPEITTYAQTDEVEYKLCRYIYLSLWLVAAAPAVPQVKSRDQSSPHPLGFLVCGSRRKVKA